MLGTLRLAPHQPLAAGQISGSSNRNTYLGGRLSTPVAAVACCPVVVSLRGSVESRSSGRSGESANGDAVRVHANSDTRRNTRIFGSEYLKQYSSTNNSKHIT